MGYDIQHQLIVRHIPNGAKSIPRDDVQSRSAAGSGNRPSAKATIEMNCAVQLLDREIGSPAPVRVDRARTPQMNRLVLYGQRGAAIDRHTPGHVKREAGGLRHDLARKRKSESKYCVAHKVSTGDHGYLPV